MLTANTHTHTNKEVGVPQYSPLRRFGMLHQNSGYVTIIGTGLRHKFRTIPLTSEGIPNSPLPRMFCTIPDALEGTAKVLHKPVSSKATLKNPFHSQVGVPNTPTLALRERLRVPQAPKWILNTPSHSQRIFTYCNPNGSQITIRFLGLLEMNTALTSFHALSL